MDCEKLTTVNGAAAIITIGDFAFCGCDVLADMPFASTIQTIGKYAFSGCKALTAPTLGSGVVVGEYAFS